MNENINRRLDPLYRAVDDQLSMIAVALEPLSRYSSEVCGGGRFDPDTRRTFRAASHASAALFNLLAAVYRDIELLRYEALRLTLDCDGMPVLSSETDLGVELQAFLDYELECIGIIK